MAAFFQLPAIQTSYAEALESQVQMQHLMSRALDSFFAQLKIQPYALRSEALDSSCSRQLLSIHCPKRRKKVKCTLL
jgi:hypothetical protein